MIIMGFKKMYSSEKVWWDLMTGETNYNYNEATFPLVCHDHHAPCWTPCWCLLRRLKLSHFQLESGWLVVIRPPATPTTLLSSSSSKKNNDKKPPNPNCCCDSCGRRCGYHQVEPAWFVYQMQWGRKPPDSAWCRCRHKFTQLPQWDKIPEASKRIPKDRAQKVVVAEVECGATNHSEQMRLSGSFLWLGRVPLLVAAPCWRQRVFAFQWADRLNIWLGGLALKWQKYSHSVRQQKYRYFCKKIRDAWYVFFQADTNNR